MFSLFHQDGSTLAVQKTGDQTWIAKQDLLAPPRLAHSSPTTMARWRVPLSMHYADYQVSVTH